jgi:hypothetical protein
LSGYAQALQRAHNEAAGGKLVLEARVILGARLGDDPLAVGLDHGC